MRARDFSNGAAKFPQKLDPTVLAALRNAGLLRTDNANRNAANGFSGTHQIDCPNGLTGSHLVNSY